MVRRLVGAVVLLVLLAGCGGQRPLTEGPLPEGPAQGLDRIVALAAELVVVSDRVAAAKAGTGQPVTDPAREAAGRPDLRWHDLRHTGAVLAAATGASLAELMARLGHSTVGAAMRYQHAASERDQIIAAALSRLAGDTVTDL